MMEEAFDLWREADIKMAAILQNIVSYNYLGIKDQRDRFYSVLSFKYESMPIEQMRDFNRRIGEEYFPVDVLEKTKEQVMELGQVLDDKDKLDMKMKKIRSLANLINENEGYELYRKNTSESERNSRLEYLLESLE